MAQETRHDSTQFAALLAFCVGLVNKYEILEYKSQIDDLRGHIRYSIVADSILGVQKDSLGHSYL